ncbi:alpha-L-rhamnosidase-like protein [Flavobacteriaceae bacterium MAR_2009_75]|nr:alpha-L-rhamnosidase-like protein [Flavobacteriaceae bacterium MAR_2009_75]
MMVLPSLNTMRPDLLEKIESLIRKGGKVYGSHPEKSPSLQNYPESDNKVENLAQKIWQDATSKIQTYGDGTVLQNMALDSALTHLKIAKDVDLNADIPVLWTHRNLPGMDIYFLTNQGDEKLEFAPSFRVKGLKPQLWDAMTGTIKHLSEYTQTENHIKMPLVMQPGQSWFVVFTNKENNAVADAYRTNFPKNKVVKELNTNWELNFSDKTIGPEETIQLDNLMDWTQSENPKVKYYSGTASYSTTFEINKEEKTEYLLDLGQLGVMASVKLNGTEIGTSWMPPHVLKLGDVLQEGENQLEFEVVNVWRNKLTGDAQLPDQEKSTWVTDDWITEEEALIPSGLMGPVTIKSLVE